MRDRCQFCGAIEVGGYHGCRSIFNQITAHSFSAAAHFAVHRAAVDCYALQHPEYFCASAKSYAAHLSGLCVAVEYNGSIEVNAAIQRWLSGPIKLVKPAVLIKRGNITVTHLQAATDVQDHIRRIHDWCRAVWLAIMTCRPPPDYTLRQHWRQKARTIMANAQLG